MNQRIQELAKQIYGTEATDQEIKFAEQIVIDCAGIAYNNDGLDNEEISRLILDAFGVK